MRNLTLKRLIRVGIIFSTLVAASYIVAFSLGSPSPEELVGEINDIFFFLLQIVPAAAFTAAIAAAAVGHHLALVGPKTPSRWDFADPARQLRWAIIAAAVAVGVYLLAIGVEIGVAAMEPPAGEAPSPAAEIFQSLEIPITQVLYALVPLFLAAAGLFLTLAFFLRVLINENRGTAGVSSVVIAGDDAPVVGVEGTAESSVPPALAIEQWWPRLSSAARGWLITNNGDAVPADIAALIERAGGTVQHGLPGVASDAEVGDEAYLTDDEVEWVEGVASGRISW